MACSLSHLYASISPNSGRFSGILEFVTSWKIITNIDDSSCAQEDVFFPPINTFSILWRCHGWMNRGKCCAEPDFMDWRSKAQLNNLYRNPLLKLFSMIWVKPDVFLWRKYFSRFPSAAVELLCCNRLLGLGLYWLFPLSICLYSGALSSFHLCFYLSGRHTCLLVCCNYLTTLFISIKDRFNHSFDVWASF